MRWKLLSWNVNGLRAAEKKGFVDWLGQTGADIVAVQETKARPEQLSEALLNPPGYRAHWSAAEKKGYSGVGTYSRLQPLAVATGLDDPRFDPEGASADQRVRAVRVLEDICIEPVTTRRMPSAPVGRIDVASLAHLHGF